MNEIRIEIFPALEGDCILISINLDKVYILIDGGRKDTYHSFLKKRLLEIYESGGKIDLLVVTHIDRDHIEGIIELISENGDNKNPKIIKINEVWFNGYKHLTIPNKIQDICYKESLILQDIINRNSLKNEETNKENKEISAKQGLTLSKLLRENNYNWNSLFDNKAISIDNKQTIQLNDEVRIRVLSPNTNKLIKLRDQWIKDLNKLKFGFKFSNEPIFEDAMELFFLKESSKESTVITKEVSFSKRKIDLESLSKTPFIIDKSRTNGSSISFIIEYKDKKLLFLGDSHPDIIAENINNLIKEDYDTKFDIVKVSHHGSDKNTNYDLLDCISSKKFIFSTNGNNHDHPNLKSLARIIFSKPKIKKKFIFNYESITSNILNKIISKNELNVEVSVTKDEKPTILDI